MAWTPDCLADAPSIIVSDIRNSIRWSVPRSCPLPLVRRWWTRRLLSLVFCRHYPRSFMSSLSTSFFVIELIGFLAASMTAFSFSSSRSNLEYLRRPMYSNSILLSHACWLGNTPNVLWWLHGRSESDVCLKAQHFQNCLHPDRHQIQRVVPNHSFHQLYPPRH